MTATSALAIDISDPFSHHHPKHYVECRDTNGNWGETRCWNDRHRPDHRGGSGVVVGDSGTRDHAISITNQTGDNYFGVFNVPVASVIIANEGHPTSTLLVTGAKAGLTVDENIIIGRDGGTGTLTISDGATVKTTNLYTGGYLSSSDRKGRGVGKVTVSGKDSSLTATSNIVLGIAEDDSNSENTLTITDGARVSAYYLGVWGGGVFQTGSKPRDDVVTIENASLKVTNLEFRHFFYSHSKAGVLRAMNGGVVTARTIEIPSGLTHTPHETPLWFDGGTLNMAAVSGSSPSAKITGQLVFGNASTLAFSAQNLDSDPDLVISKKLVNPTFETGLDSQTFDALVLEVTPGTSGATPQLGTEFTVIEATDGVTINTSKVSVKSGYNFLDATARFDGTKGYLTLTKSANAVTSKAVTGNEKAVGGIIEELGSGHAVHDAFIGTPSSQSASSAYNGLTGETHASAASGSFHSAFASSGVISNRMQGTQQSLGTSSSTAFHGEGEGYAPFLSAPEIWFRGYGNVQSVEGSGSAADTDTATGGLMAGVDALVGDAARLGLAFGYSRTFSNTSERFSKSRIDGYHGFVYGNAQFGPIGLQAGLGATYNQIDASRETGIPGLPGILSADYTGWTGQAWVEGAYGIPFGLASSVEPFAGLSLVSNHSGSFTETGNAAALNVSATHQTNLFSTLGVRLGHEIDLSDSSSFRVSGSLGWRHAFGDITPDSTMSYASGSSSFSISGLPLERDTIVFDAGLDMAVSDSALIDLRYSGQLGARAQDHGIKGTLRLSF
ncbi:autotransporter domain-containing protein [Roseibium sp.]|uniref:autotransporter family protein n=1 Tax=Roseibium sp. TaxID=1936156 RepID=UPI003A98495D